VAAGFEPTVSFREYFLTSITEYSAYYLWRFILPLRLSMDPDPATIKTPLNFGFLLSAGILLTLAAGVFWLRRGRPLAALGIALILVSPLSAYCLFPLADVVAEHRTYISFLGAAIVIADALRSRSVTAVSVGLLIFYSWLTIERNKLWNDEVLLWEDASRQAPEKIRPHLNLGALYQARGNATEAAREYNFVLQRVPDHAVSLSNLSSLYLAANDLAKAEEVLNRAIARQTSFPVVYLNLAVVRMRETRFDEAQRLLEKAVSLNPQQQLVHHNLGDVMLQQGRPSEAIAEYLFEILLNPDFVMTHLHLAIAYQAVGMPGMAREQYLIVQRLDPGNQEARSALEKLK
jgi:Tfp pilus assembly protein PilF